MIHPLGGKAALVTGSASGIGRATIDALADAGAQVMGLDRVAPSDSRHRFILADLTREDEVIAGIDEIARQLGAIDILVNNASMMREAAIRDVTVTDIDEHFSVNVRGTVLVTRQVLTVMRKGGRIINLASELAYVGRQRASIYVATKAAILGLTRSWARELAPDILVNAVAPGPTDTPLLNFANMTPEQKALEVTQPLGRIGRPEEIAAAIVFLAGPGATFITGHCLGVNGGAAMA